MYTFKLCPPEKHYYRMTVEAGKTYSWCACGHSKSQPFCDGSHGKSGTGKTPFHYTAEATKDVSFCGCKKTKTPPFCDGSHKQA